MKGKMPPHALAMMLTAKIPQGVLLNTRGDKFNSMVIGWANAGMTWGVFTVAVYVREGRYTKAQIDKTGEFTISIPTEERPLSPEVLKICGRKSGRDTDKAAEAGFTLEEPDVIGVPGIREYPYTMECKVLYSSRIEAADLPEHIRSAMYPQDVEGTAPGANRDPHTLYIAEIVSGYTIE